MRIPITIIYCILFVFSCKTTGVKIQNDKLHLKLYKSILLMPTQFKGYGNYDLNLSEYLQSKFQTQFQRFFDDQSFKTHRVEPTTHPLKIDLITQAQKHFDDTSAIIELNNKDLDFNMGQLTKDLGDLYDSELVLFSLFVHYSPVDNDSEIRFLKNKFNSNGKVISLLNSNKPHTFFCFGIIDVNTGRFLAYRSNKSNINIEEDFKSILTLLIGFLNELH